MTAAQDLIEGICKDKYDQDGVWADIDNWNPAEMKEFMDEIKQLQLDAEKWKQLDNWVDIIYQGVSPSIYKTIGEEVCRLLDK